MQLCAYIHFNGNCRKAMTFYKKCLGGKLSFQTVSELPQSESLPSFMQRSILTALLQTKHFQLAGTDLNNESVYLPDNSFSLLLQCDSESDLKRLYKQLSAGGVKTQLLQKNFYGVVIGSVKDRFGINWVLQC
ncbi:MAG TPA: VOC family protein [Bacteroidia bacterium]|nr:VOC family protein [Bacteroidia bacterium]